jgi:hypothetical protein
MNRPHGRLQCSQLLGGEFLTTPVTLQNEIRTDADREYEDCDLNIIDVMFVGTIKDLKLEVNHICPSDERD